jgi:hypothetical protein
MPSGKEQVAGRTAIAQLDNKRSPCLPQNLTEQPRGIAATPTYQILIDRLPVTLQVLQLLLYKRWVPILKVDVP